MIFNTLYFSLTHLINHFPYPLLQSIWFAGERLGLQGRGLVCRGVWFAGERSGLQGKALVCRGDMKSMRDAEIESDHFLVRAKIRLKIK
jgi:hypothetical protein